MNQVWIVFENGHIIGIYAARECLISSISAAIVSQSDDRIVWNNGMQAKMHIVYHRVKKIV
jgi:hypothetical protein